MIPVIPIIFCGHSVPDSNSYTKSILAEKVDH